MNPEELSLLLPHIASHIRNSISSLYLAALQLAPHEKREHDPNLDARAALLEQSYYRLVRLVNSFTSAKYFSNTPLPLRDGNIVEWVENIFEQVESLAKMRGLDMRYSCAMEKHICAFCPAALDQVFYQLISNAFKFTPPGGHIFVVLRISRGNVLLSVEDDGPGIPQDRLSTIFEFRPSDVPTSPPHGVGLGLPLCRRIAIAHGGMMMAESHAGKGTRFTLSIPNKQCGVTTVSDFDQDYTGGLNRSLLALSDALPPEAFLVRNLD
ncbi:MAG: sensor histidine kinase [Oscillibacter sp.]|nr:sensor histidine kinase [Oscillibacter sp.]